MQKCKTLLVTTAQLAGLAIAPVAHAQIDVDIGVPPVCSCSYYDYAPYACAPYGFYGPGYFYGGVFWGMGLWAGWGYGHGWRGHRFRDGGGTYRGGGGMANRSSFARSGGQYKAGVARCVEVHLPTLEAERVPAQLARMRLVAAQLAAAPRAVTVVAMPVAAEDLSAAVADIDSRGAVVTNAQVAEQWGSTAPLFCHLFQILITQISAQLSALDQR